MKDDEKVDGIPRFSDDEKDSPYSLMVVLKGPWGTYDWVSHKISFSIFSSKWRQVGSQSESKIRTPYNNTNYYWSVQGHKGMWGRPLLILMGIDQWLLVMMHFLTHASMDLLSNNLLKYSSCLEEWTVLTFE